GRTRPPRPPGLARRRALTDRGSSGPSGRSHDTRPRRRDPLGGGPPRRYDRRMSEPAAQPGPPRQHPARPDEAAAEPSRAPELPPRVAAEPPRVDPDRRSDVDEWGRSERWRALARTLYGPVYRDWFRAEWQGLEHSPRHGGALLVANHAGAI